jgi:hypothetical protein
VAPLRLGGLRGKKSTPSVWLGGTGEFIAVGKQEQEQRELQGVSGQLSEEASRHRYANVFILMLVGIKSTLGLCKFVIDYSRDCAHAFIFSLIALVA